MVLGLSRERTTLARRAPVLERTGPVYGWDDWLIERGSVQWEAPADLTGGFPGFGAHGCRLECGQVRVTERFLLVNEGKGNGFGLPLGWLVDADVIPSPLRGDRGEVVLRVRYNDRDRVRTFLVRFRGPFLALRGPRRAEQAMAALREVGLEAGAEDIPPLPEDHPFRPGGRQVRAGERHLERRRLGGGRAGRESASCDVWLTTRSVIWGGSMGDGVLRLSLDRILDVVPSELDGRGRDACPLPVVRRRGGRAARSALRLRPPAPGPALPPRTGCVARRSVSPGHPARLHPGATTSVAIGPGPGGGR